jgi:hypothetical protein
VILRKSPLLDFPNNLDNQTNQITTMGKAIRDNLVPNKVPDLAFTSTMINLMRERLHQDKQRAYHAIQQAQLGRLSIDLLPQDITSEIFEVVSARSQYYKTFYGRNLRMFVIS